MIKIPAGSIQLEGELTQPEGSSGLVIFAHGSGSSRLSPRNLDVARSLNEAGLATLLFDLLTPAEAADRSNVFDIPLLGDRLVETTKWVREIEVTGGLPVGYFGASTGAGAALLAAADLGKDVAAVVSRGGRPDLAAPRLGDVSAPTLMIVGGNDFQVIELNRKAADLLACEYELSIIPGATHLFEEPGALAQVAELAGDWFVRYLADDADR